MNVTQTMEAVVTHVQTLMKVINAHVVLVTFLLMMIMGVMVCYIIYTAVKYKYVIILLSNIFLSP